MRFIVGLLLGFAAGFAGAILFAPDKSKGREVDWPLGAEPDDISANVNGNGFQGKLQGLRERVNEAMEEAKKAQAEAEREMQARYEKVAGRPSRKSK
jgi:gas vesicle protein